MKFSALTRAVWLVFLALGVHADVDQPGLSDDPFTTWNLYTRAKRLNVPLGEQLFGPDYLGREWDFSAPDRGGFTFFDNVDDLAVSDDNALAFTLTDKPATLGWGNFGDKLPEHRKKTFWKKVNIRFRAKQTGNTPTTWKLACYYRGRYQKQTDKQRRYGATSEATLEGRDWTTLGFKNFASRNDPGSDALSVEISGAAGTRIEISRLAIGRDYYAGCFRTIVDLPRGKVWRAVADVGNQSILYVNGKEVKTGSLIRTRPYNRGGAWQWFRNEAVDFTAYLKPGKNCIALRGGSSYMPPTLYMRGSVIMESGKRTEINSDETWTWRQRPEPGWTEADFDDEAWQHPGTKSTNLQSAHNYPDAQAVKGWRLYLQSKSGRPVYDGLMTLENPEDRRLFFSDSEPFTVVVRTPLGMADRGPSLRWRIRRYRKGSLSEAGTGTADTFIEEGSDLRTTVRTDPLPRGVYLLSLEMLDRNGSRVEQRIPEPFVVVGRLPMRTVAGHTYEQGLDLELEMDVDFTTPDDPAHPWVEADAVLTRSFNYTEELEQPVWDPIVVTRHGLTYRETRPEYGAQFSYLLQEVKHPGDWYLFVVDYPDDAERCIAVACNSEMDIRKDRRNAMTNKSGSSVWTGNRYPLSYGMKQLRFPYRPDAGKTAVNIQSLMKHTAAAAARLRVYHVKNGLPALDVPETNRRRLGYLTESGTFRPLSRWSNIYHTFSFRDTPILMPPDSFARYDDNPAEQMCHVLEDWLDMTEHYVQYLRFTGQNSHVMACLQYNDTANPYNERGNVETPRIIEDLRDVEARCFRDNGIDFLASVEFCGHSSLEFGQDPRVSTSVWSKDGVEINVNDGFYGANFNHPRVRGIMLGHTRDIAEKFRDLPNFLGVNWTTYFGGDWLPVWRTDYMGYRGQPLAVGYGDTTIRKFETETGIEIPGIDPNDPERFRMRYQFLTSEAMRDAWIDWRCKALKDAFAEVAAELRTYRDDLVVAATPFFYGVHVREWHDSGLPFREYLRQNGWDTRRFHEDSRLWLTQTTSATTKYEAHHMKPRYAAWWDLAVHPDIYEAFNSPQGPRSVMVQHHWLEMERFAAALPFREGWARPGQATMEAHATGAYACEVYAQAMIGADPHHIMYAFSDGGICIGFEQELRAFNRVYRALPAERFKPYEGTGFRTNLAIREFRKYGKLFLYVVNPGYWPIRGQIEVRDGEQAVHMPIRESVLKPRRNGAIVLPVDLKPYGLAAFEITGEEAAVAGWSVRPPDGEHLEHMRGIIARVETLMADPLVRVALTRHDTDLVGETLRRARHAMDQQRYALAWSLLTDARFWIAWHDYLEKQAALTANITERDADPLAVTTAIRSLTVVQTGEPPVLDGRLDDPAWKESRAAAGFIEQEAAPAKVGTTVRAVWNKGNLYLAYRMKDNFPDRVRATAASEDTFWKSEDDMGIVFLQPDPTRPDYVQLGFNLAGPQFDQKVISKHRETPGFSPDWHVTAAVTEQGWVAEVRIPLAELKLDGSMQPGTTWRGNFCRLFRFNRIPHSTWSHMPRGWHDPDHFGRLEFVK